MNENLVHDTCCKVLEELGNAGFEWWEYPTLIDAIEDRIRDGLVQAHQEHWTFSSVPQRTIDTFDESPRP